MRVKYDRWYTNNTGAEPNADNWVVDVSNNGGTSWLNVENTTVSAAQWLTIVVDIDALFGAGAANQVRLRFVASDLAGGSVVEAGVDELRILGEPEGATDAPVLAGDVVAHVLALEAAQPNPFSGTTKIAYAVPSGGAVDLAVYNVSGQVVRTLATGVRESGRYTAAWDGRDNFGNKVSSGVYFYRLTAGTQSLTKKVTLMK